MDLKSLMVDTKEAWVEYPGYDGFKVLVVNLARDKLIALRKNAMITTMDRKTRTPKEELNEKKFIRDFSDATIKDWKGFKIKYLEELMLIADTNDPEAELDYSPDNAELLVSNSNEFDTWLNNTVYDLNLFRSKSNRETMEAPRELPE